MSGFEIHVPDTNVQDGSAPISWCVTPEFIQELSKNKVENPYVYIIVAPVKNYAEVKERRYAVPLQSMMAYVEFGSVGKNNVFAFVAGEKWRQRFFRPHSHVRWMSTHVNSSYTTDADGDWEYQLRSGEDFYGYGATSIRVMVPPNVFAKEPPEWLSAWVNWLYDLPPIDSCQFKQRLYFFGAHLQFLVFAVFMTIRIMTYTFLRLLLIGNVSARPILHPFRHDFDDLQDTSNGGIEFLPKRWSKGAWWSSLYIPSTPLVVLFITSLVSLAPSVTFATALVSSVEGAFAWVVFVTSVALVVKGVRVLWEKIRLQPYEESTCAREEAMARRALKIERREAAKRRAEEAEEQRLFWYRKPEAVAPFICTPDKPKAPLTSVADLPKERQTVWLRIAEYKASSCKPYAK